LVISDETARGFIAALDYFQTEGKFDRKKYEAALADQRISPTQFAEKVRRAMVMEQYQNSIINSAFATTYDVDRYFRLQNQEREVEYVAVAVESEKESLSEDEINNYYQSHLASYKTPERVAIDYLELSLEELAKTVKPTEDQLQAYYNEQKDLYITKERRKISHILVSLAPDADVEATNAALDKAKNIRKRLDNDDFATVAKEVSDDKVSAKNGGDLGLISQGVMEKNFEDAAFALETGEISQPVKTSFGYHLIKVTELEPEIVKAFDEVRDEVAAAYQRSEAENAFYELGEKLSELTYENPDNLAVAAEELGLIVKKSELFTREAGKGVAAEPAVRNAAFSEDVLGGNNSEPVELGSDRVIVLRVNQHLRAETQALDVVRKDVESSILRDKALERARATAESLYKQLQEGKSLETIAKEHRLEIHRPGFISRTDRGLPWEMKKAIFKAVKPGKDVLTPILIPLSDGSHAVANVLKVKESGADKVDSEQRKMAEANIARAKGREVFNALLSELRNQADVTLNKRAAED
ncbi:MAG: peptidylprolyl isomerase, partial [Pseudomonadota bacterium]